MKNMLIIFSLCIALFACSKPDSYDSHGNPITLNHYRGQWLIVNYWAPWCKPCLTELPDLNQLYTQNKNNIMVIAVSFDKLSNDKINAFHKKYALNFPMLQHFPSKKYGIENINYLPMTLLINPQGKLYKTLYGPQTKEALLKEMNASTLQTPATTYANTSSNRQPKGSNP